MEGVLNELALFAGVGGGILGTHLLGFRPVCAVEIEPYAREVLLRRQEDKILPPFPIWDDVRTFDGKPWRGIVDVVSAGFPCQPFSVAGSQKGSDDERNGWPDTIRILREVGPKFALLENVPGLVRFDYFGEILGDLAEAGFDVEWGVVSAEETGAPHKRERLWILATNSNMLSRNAKQKSQHQRPKKSIGSSKRGLESYLADSNGSHGEGVQLTERGKQESTITKFNGWWKTEPNVGRVANGVANRVDRLKAIGNGQVPAVVAAAWNLLTS